MRVTPGLAPGAREMVDRIMHGFCRCPNFRPRTHVGCLIHHKLQFQRDLAPLVLTGTCTHVYIPTIHIILKIFKKNLFRAGQRWLTPLISALETEAGGYEFQVSLVYRVDFQDSQCCTEKLISWVRFVKKSLKSTLAIVKSNIKQGYMRPCL